MPDDPKPDAARALAAVLGLDAPIAVVDVGANPIDGAPPYRPLLDLGLARVTGFEPQADALARLRAAAGPHETYLPDAVGDGAVHTLHLCRAPGMASLLAPDPDALALFHGFPEWGEVTATRAVATRRLDDIPEVDAIDYLKIDVQGAECLVFEGARAKLAGAVAVHTEVSFVPLYRGQPPFGAVDLWLREAGFLPHAFAAINRRAIAPTMIGNDVYAGLNQLLEADVVYVRDLRRPDALDDGRLRRLAAVAQCCYGSFDLAIRCLAILAQRGAVAADATARFVAALQAR
ncbi:MAG: FkbM family methyltransferase [Rhodospirillales bacterium]